MKTLILMRHAKAEQGNFETNDFDRKLSAKGKEDGKIVAKELKKLTKKLDYIFSSSAKRTFKTAKIVAEQFDIDKSNIVLSSELYEADINEYKEIIRNFDDTIEGNFLMVGHNPAIGQLANMLSKNKIEVFKPGAFAIFSLSISTWKMFNLEANIKFDFFEP